MLFNVMPRLLFTALFISNTKWNVFFPFCSFSLIENHKYLRFSVLSPISSIWDLVLESPNETVFFLGDGAFPFSVTFCIFSGVFSSLFRFPRAPRKQVEVDLEEVEVKIKFWIHLLNFTQYLPFASISVCSSSRLPSSGSCLISSATNVCFLDIFEGLPLPSVRGFSSPVPYNGVKRLLSYHLYLREKASNLYSNIICK